MPATPPTIEKLKQSRTVCTITFTPEEVQRAEDQALQKFAASVNLKGFRPGKAPLSAVRERVQDDALLEETIRILMQEQLPSLAEANKLAPVIPPKVEAVSRMPLTVKVTFIERPEVKLKGLEKLKIDRTEPTIDPKDLQKVIDSVREEHRILTPVDRAAKEGDQIVIDFHAHDASGQHVPGLEAQGYPVTIGAARLLPGFEPQLVGLKKGDAKEFVITLPESHAAEQLRGKPVTFHVSAVRVEEVTLPELTDTFAKEKLNAASAADFRASVEKSLKAQEEQFAGIERERKLLEEIKNRTLVDPAPELMEEEVSSLLEEWVQRLERQGQNVEEWLKREKKTPQQLREDLKSQALDRIKLRLGVAAIIEERKITLTEEEKKAATDAALREVPDEHKEGARKYYAPGGQGHAEVLWQALVRKTLDSFLL